MRVSVDLIEKTLTNKGGVMRKIEFVIMSAERAGLSKEENNMRTMALRECFKSEGVSFKEVKGVYKGVEEASFVVVGCGEELVRELCMAFDQECWLAVDSNRYGVLKFTDGREGYLGRFRSVSSVVGEDAYTYDAALN